jgi:predicted transglutaminase-like cysteine proteinase
MSPQKQLFAMCADRADACLSDFLLHNTVVLLCFFAGCIFAGSVFFYSGDAHAAAGDLIFDKPPVDVDWGVVQSPEQMLGSDGAEPPAKAGAEQTGQEMRARAAPVNVQPAASPAAADKKRADRLFGTVEFRSKLKAMPKWERVLKAYAGKSDIDSAFGPSRQREAAAWAQLKAKVAKASDLEKAKAVNAFFNQWPYRLDIDTYGVSDYWATPDEFIKNSGDCEDYAITKMYALKQLGVSPDNLRVIALRDNIRNLDHAVLAVYTEDTIYILDNVTKLVLTHDNFTHYRPYFSVNGVYKWAHIPPK